MRILSTLFGVLGGVAGLIAAYFFFALMMWAGGPKTSVQAVVLWGFLLALLAASLLSFIGGLLNPRRPMARGSLATSVVLWILCGLLVGGLALLDPTKPVGVIEAAKVAATMALPSLLPLAALAVAAWRARRLRAV